MKPLFAFLGWFAFVLFIFLLGQISVAGKPIGRWIAQETTDVVLMGDQAMRKYAWYDGGIDGAWVHRSVKSVFGLSSESDHDSKKKSFVDSGPESEKMDSEDREALIELLH